MCGFEEAYYKKPGLWLRLFYSGRISQIRESLSHEIFRSCHFFESLSSHQLTPISLEKYKKFNWNTYMIFFGFFKEKFLSQNEPQKSKKIQKMLRKSAASNAWAAICKNGQFS